MRSHAGAPLRGRHDPARRGPPEARGEATHGAQEWKQIDVSAIQLAVDWRARREIQSKLRELARSGERRSKESLAELLRAAIAALRRAESSWLYCAISNYQPMSAASAEGIFRQLAADARSRNADRTIGEGEGVVVVTLIVAASAKLLDMEKANEAANIKSLLTALSGVANPRSLVAMEVIWSPAAEDDRLSTAELERLYPRLENLAS